MRTLSNNADKEEAPLRTERLLFKLEAEELLNPESYV